MANARKQERSTVAEVEDLKLFDFEKGPIISVELNLELIPMFLYKTRGRSEESLEATNVIRTPDGQRLEQYVRVVGGRDYGLPGPTERDVYVGIMKLVHRAGGIPADGKVSFSLYELLKILGKNRGGNNYEKVRESLDRIADSVIYAQNAFYDRKTEQFRTHRFTPWSVHFASTRQGQGRSAERHVLKFHEILVRSYNSGFLKTLDTDFFFSLKSPMAKSLYQLVDAKRQGGLSWTVGVQPLRQLIPMPESYRYDSKIREKIEPGLTELKRRGFLESADYEQRGEDQVVCFRIARRFVEARERPQVSLSSRERDAADALIRHGVSSAKAEKLVSANGASHCRRYLDALTHQTGIANPAGWLIRYIENAWPVTLPEQASPEWKATSERATPEGDGPSPGQATADRPDEAHVRKALKQRLEAGEFDKTIADLEALPYEQYGRFVAARAPIVDAEENRYYVSLEGDLYLYVGPPEPHNRFLLCALDRAQDKVIDA
jgi:Replication initiator protein A